MQNAGLFALLQSENDMENPGSNYPLLVTQQECKLIRSARKGYTWTNKKMQWCGILFCTDILRFYSTNQTSQDFAHHKRSLKNLKTDASLLWNTQCVLCLCQRKILSPAWACSICRNQFQLWFPKPFYQNSKKTMREKQIILQNSRTEYFAKCLLCS